MNVILQDRFRQRVSEVLQIKGWPQTRLASLLGWTPQTVNDVMRGRREPGLKTIENFAAALDVDPSVLVSGKSVVAEDLSVPA